MEFNTTKCKILHVGKTNQRFQYMMDNQILESVTEERDLGILVSSDLKVSANCVAAYNKANMILGMINRTITFRPKDILVSYINLLFSHWSNIVLLLDHRIIKRIKI